MSTPSSIFGEAFMAAIREAVREEAFSLTECGAFRAFQCFPFADRFLLARFEQLQRRQDKFD
jgi:hypothetical protein